MEHQRVRIADIAEELGTSTATVSADSYGGGFKAGEYLRQIGHKKVLCIADNYKRNETWGLPKAICIAGNQPCKTFQYSTTMQVIL
ncbi:MAG: hypothetical protein K1W15_04805 [Lachnospiraceae bacterium]